ncbi:MAG TPA: hypothetical protein VN329_10310 [Roseomonas sp.]|nr:hypothetical protein [Roseomonas sp.]
MMEALPHLPMAEPLLLAVLVLGGLALRRWAGGRVAATGTVLIWLALAIALVWAGGNLLILAQMVGG